MVVSAQAIDPDQSPWDAWTPAHVAGLLEGVRVPWYVAAGWAIDLFLGGEPRPHEDLEIAVPNTRFDEFLEALPGVDVFVVTGPAELTALAQARDRLADTHQTWIRDRTTGAWRLDVFREPSDGDTWVCRREPAIRMPYAQLIERTADGIPCGRPEVMLLFKAKRADLEKNRRDLALTLPRLEPERRAWLGRALEQVHPSHPWLAEIEGSAA
jgi:Aminoglycoside-2''-adenylyltransferase